MHDQVIAQAQMEAQKLKLKRREHLLERPFVKARQQLDSLSQRPDYAEIARYLVREAVEHLGSGEMIVRADAETQKLLDDSALDRLSDELGVRLQVGKPLERGVGVVVETPDGHRRYDNRLETRMTRLQESLRMSVYHILMGEAP